MERAVGLVPDLAALVREVESVPLVSIEDGSGSSHFDGPEGWIHGLAMARLRRADTAVFYPYIADAIGGLRAFLDEQYGDVVQIMVNRLAAGKNLDAHKDGEPNRARFHLPVVTHPDVYWWDELDGACTMEAGTWYGPVPYCGILHAVGNPSPVDRVHLIVDFERGV